MSQKKDQRIVRTEEAVLEAGIKALLSNHSAGMADIAKAAGIGRATLYRHFDSREALVRKLALSCYQEIDNAYAPFEHLEGKAAILKIIEIAMPMASRFNFLARLWSIVEEDEEVQRIEEQSQQEMCFLFEQAKAAGEIDANLPIAWLSASFDHILMAGWHLVESGDASVEQAASYAARSFFNGCSNDK